MPQTLGGRSPKIPLGRALHPQKPNPIMAARSSPQAGDEQQKGARLLKLGVCAIKYTQRSQEPRTTLSTAQVSWQSTPRWPKASSEGWFDTISKALPFGSAIQQFQLYSSILRRKNRDVHICVYLFGCKDGHHTFYPKG